jgi:ADP-dependent NAD(P)H-hydrate dehydratase
MSPARITPELLRRHALPWPASDTDKNTRGTVLVAGGSTTSPGAVILSGVAALRAGAGKVMLVVPQPLATPIAIAVPEAGVHAFAVTPAGDPVARAAAAQIGALLAGVDAGLIGPGLADESAAQELARRILDATVGPGFVIDALSLTGLWDAREILSRHHGRLVITPHAGEMAQLTGKSKAEIAADPLRSASEAAQHLNCIVVLKGATTVVAQPEGTLYLHESEIVGLATSGSGDVLAGILAGLMARGASAIAAALWSVHLHAQAGRRLSERIGALGFLARELPSEIPLLMDAITPRPE